MLDFHKRETRAFLNSDEEVEAWLLHQEKLDAQLRDGSKGFALRGRMHAVLRKGNGGLMVVRKDNGITNAGWDFISNSIGNRAAAGATAAMGWIAIGTGATAFAAGNTALVTENTRQAATYAHTSGTKIFTFTTTFAAGVATATLTEAGVFNLVTIGGTMLDRVVFGGIAKAAGDSLVQTFTFTMS